MSKSILTFDDSVRDNTFREFINGWTRIDEEFAEYLAGKSVAIVGRGCNDEYEQGHLIDSFDVVVRMHHPLPHVPKESPYFPAEHEYIGFNFNYAEHWKKCIGARTDIFYLADLDDNSVALAARDLDNMRRIRHVCCEPDCDMFLAAQLAEQRYVRFMTPGHVSQCEELIGSRPLKGTSIICDILKHEVTEAYLTGFSCWVTEDGRIDAAWRPMPGVKPWNDFNFLKRLACDERVRVDLMMDKLLDAHGVWIDRSRSEGEAFSALPHSKNNVDY